jgi:hypothetical protein
MQPSAAATTLFFFYIFLKIGTLFEIFDIRKDYEAWTKELYPRHKNPKCRLFWCLIEFIDCAGIFKQSMRVMNRVGIGLSHRPASLHSLGELTPWNRFLDSLNFKNSDSGMDEGTIKTQKPKCRLYWC